MVYFYTHKKAWNYCAVFELKGLRNLYARMSLVESHNNEKL